jgi:hypothetical protein
MTDPNAPKGDDLLSEAVTEIKAMAKEGAAHPSTKPVLIGAGAGAVAGLVAGTVLPIVSWPIGLVAGAGYMLYKRIRP